MTANHFTFTIGMSKPGMHGEDSLARQYGMMAYPDSYLIGPDGKIRFSSHGYDEASLRAALQQAKVSTETCDTLRTDVCITT